VRRWPEPADLHFLLSHTKHNWSPAADDADDDGATHDMVDKCGDASQPRWDLLFSVHIMYEVVVSFVGEKEV
jgi:hypothetical protein